jgi:hypothetical protein
VARGWTPVAAAGGWYRAAKRRSSRRAAEEEQALGERSATLLPPPAHPERVAAPQPDVFAPPPPARQLLVRQQSVSGQSRPRWLFVAAHGGSGASLLARLSWQPYETAVAVGETAERSAEELAFGVNAGRAWPNPALEPTNLAVVVCQTTMRGLAWARDLATQYLAGCVPAGLQLLGVVTVADQPGRLPAPLAGARHLLTGVYAHVWPAPYVPEYRLLTRLPAEPCPPTHPAVADVLAAIRSAASAATSGKGPHA